ncbi:Rhodanese/Cell cycle control phosphatase superfamily protein [Prunus dulcis]|uniref:Rhodanese/Cell cycle control phosphatase superfamily protein n=1 Tax=Prunus dulcis TaxID=3755 RepID=A0A4Y1RXN7_PRUDU|nr:Rhodanese/Cell cycle control phosphatase superfamily protein [Prunus dulcis]
MVPTSSCSYHSQISLHGGLHANSPFQKDFEARYIAECRGSLGLSFAMHFQRDSFKAHATKSLYSNFVKSTEQSVSMDFVNRSSCSNESDYLNCKYSDMWSSSTGTLYKQHPLGMVELKYVESSSLLAPDEGLMDLTNQSTENASILSGPVEPESILAADLTPENVTSASDPLDIDGDQLSSVKTSIEDFIDGVNKSFSASVDKGGSSVKSSLDAITSSVSSVVKSANEAVDNAVGRMFSTIDQTGQLGGSKMANFSSDFKEATSKGLRTFVVVEDSLSNGVSFVVSSYQSAKDFLPPDVSDALNLSEKRAAEFLGPAKSAFQQVYIAIEGLEENLGLDPNDPIIAFVIFLGTSATLWVIYLVRTFSGYAGDLSPQSTLELLTGKENAVLIDVMREKEGIPDLRRTARFRYASVTLPEVDGSLWKLLKSGKDLDDTLTAAVIRNLKIVQDRSKVIIMDGDGTRSKGIARSLRKLGLKASSKPMVILDTGTNSWVKHGLRIKELKPETTLTILNEEAEAILENINPSRAQVLGYGVGLIAASYALLGEYICYVL